MTEILAIFRSRAQAMDCNTRLRKNGVNSALINTPKEANVGCGLSVKYPQALEKKARMIVLSGRYSAFYGFLTMSTIYGKTYFIRTQ